MRFQSSESGASAYEEGAMRVAKAKKILLLRRAQPAVQLKSKPDSGICCIRFPGELIAKFYLDFYLAKLVPSQYSAEPIVAKDVSARG